MIARYIQIIKIIDTLEFLNITPTGHAIARSINSVSRATTYRDLNKMEKLSMVCALDLELANGVVSKSWFVTDRGNEFYRSQLELPF